MEALLRFESAFNFTPIFSPASPALVGSVFCELFHRYHRHLNVMIEKLFIFFSFF